MGVGGQVRVRAGFRGLVSLGTGTGFKKMVQREPSRPRADVPTNVLVCCSTIFAKTLPDSTLGRALGGETCEKHFVSQGLPGASMPIQNANTETQARNAKMLAYASSLWF